MWYTTNQLFAKCSLFVLYWRIFSINRSFKIGIIVLVVVQVCWFIAFFFSTVFLCVPVSKWWDVLDVEPGHCLNDAIYLACEEPPNSLVDFVMIGLAMYMIKRLHVQSKSTKLRLAIIFAIGGLSGIIGIVKVIEVHLDSHSNGSKQIPFPYV
jgi:hypothetical protein